MWPQGCCSLGSPGQLGELWGPLAQCWVLAGLDPPHCHPLWAGAGLGGTGNAVGSDFSPGSLAWLPPHSCPFPLLLLAGGTCPSSGPIPGTWPNLPKAAQTSPPCTARLMPSASPGLRGVMSGETLGAVMRLCKGRGQTGHPLGLWQRGWHRGSCATFGHPSSSCTTLSPGCLLPAPSSRQEGAVALLETARSCLVPLPQLPELGGLEWLESHTPCVPCPAPLASARQPWWWWPQPGGEGQVGVVLPLCSIVPWRVYVGVWAPWDLCGAG